MDSHTRILGAEDGLVSHYIAEIRDVDVQSDRLRFRRNIERLGEIMASEIARELPFKDQVVTTSLGQANCRVLAQQPVLATILRAGLPLHQGLLNYFDGADNAFISAYRKHEGDDASFEVEIEYLSSPPVDDRIVLLADPMLASGSSMVLAWKALLERGTPSQLHVVSVIASSEGLAFARESLPESTKFWIAAVDEEMTSHKYIVPGLGDAGDLCYGAKE